ncbi:MAG: PQQ-binding-like beta-propeller repeat protein [Acidobacteria bacterium]|nr:PQQ-binding-like beta-propeller repeat protein [Acidobacteriota bacterium]
MHSRALWALVAFLSLPLTAGDYRTWSGYHGGPGRTHYSTLNQINRDNVSRLRVAWTFDTGDASKGSEMQCNPIVIGRLAYVTTPKLRVLALDAATGRLVWSFNPFAQQKLNARFRNRGVTYWTDGVEGRIFFVAQQYLYALNARTGELLTSFGAAGRVDLREGLGRRVEGLFVSATTPGVIYKDLLIQGSIMSEDLPSAPGDIRAFDVRSGKLRWSFHTIPHPGEFGYNTWPRDTWKHTGAANNWGGMALDIERGIVFAPTGSASFDFYGSDRAGDNLFANTLLALDASTGKRLWHFQAVKHDLWDRDFPTSPTLVTIQRDGRSVDAVAQPTKSGHVFVFERSTGKPVFPIEYSKAPPSDIDGEVAAATQPLPVKPPAFSRQRLTEDMLTTRTPEAHAAVLEQFRQVRSAGQFIPPSLQGSIVFPGFDGGAEWGGASFDPETGLLYVNANEQAWILKLVPRTAGGPGHTGPDLYLKHCAGCHQADRKGALPQFPPLVDIGDKLGDSELRTTIRSGTGRMPSFAGLGSDAIRAIATFLLTGESQQATAKSIDIPYLKYSLPGYNKFVDPDGYPAVQPPWGTLSAIDLNRGEIRWQIPFGEIPALAAKGLRNTGSENYGGAVVTSSGLLFIGATDFDSKFHAFDKLSGKLLWETTLPAGGNATPSTYQVDGRQYIVIAAGGGKSGQVSSGSYVAFSLPAE